VLKVQKSLSRAPLGSFGKSLRDVAAGVEARLIQMKQQEDAGSASSRPATSSAARGTTLQLPQSRGGGEQSSAGPVISPRSPKVMGPTAPTAASGTNRSSDQIGPLNACDGYDGRPATRDGSRPCTQDGGGRWRVGSFGGRPVTRDVPCVDRVRPSTRDGARLQQMIDGGGSRRGAAAEGAVRPRTREGVRPPTRSGTGERRAQDVSIRQVTGGRRKRHSNQHAPEILNLENASSPSPEPRPACAHWAPECLSPCMDADESVELLE